MFKIEKELIKYLNIYSLIYIIYPQVFFFLLPIILKVKKKHLKKI